MSGATLVTPTVPCTTCHGGGLVQRWSLSNRAPGNSSGEDCMVFARCPDCPDDGTGNACGTGRRPLPAVFS